MTDHQQNTETQPKKPRRRKAAAPLRSAPSGNQPARSDAAKVADAVVRHKTATALATIAVLFVTTDDVGQLALGVVEQVSRDMVAERCEQLLKNTKKAAEVAAYEIQPDRFLNWSDDPIAQIKLPWED